MVDIVCSHATVLDLPGSCYVFTSGSTEAIKVNSWNLSPISPSVVPCAWLCTSVCSILTNLNIHKGPKIGDIPIFGPLLCLINVHVSYKQ